MEKVRKKDTTKENYNFGLGLNIRSVDFTLLIRIGETKKSKAKIH